MNASLFRWRLGAAILLLACAGVTRTRAAWHQEVTTDKNSGIAVSISSPFEHCLPQGYLPLWVTIRNDSGTARTWNISCTGGMTYGNYGNREISSGSLRVENGQTARVPVLMALDPSSLGPYLSGSVRLDGYAIPFESSTQVPGINAAGKGRRTAAVGMSEGLATPIWASLSKRYADDGHDLIGTPVDLGQLGGDWRALSGLDALWLSDADFTALEAAHRTAVHDWVAQGGRLFVCTGNADPALRAGLGLPENADDAAVGLGHVELFAWDGKPLGLDAVAEVIDRTNSRAADAVPARVDWPMVEAMGTIPLNVPVLIAFIAVFAVVVGPLNLFWFANASRRHRLFWTTPLLSVGASLLLAGFIVLEDGFGGHGERVLFCLLLPADKKAVVTQEQVTRTGVLFSREFRTSEDAILTALPLGSGRERRIREQNGRVYAGDWFASRSVQTLRAEAVVPSRAEIGLVSADSAAPTLTSSVPATIREIRYKDLNGKRWRGENLRTGERVTLRPDPAEGSEGPLLDGSSSLDETARSFAGRPGYFVAVADDGPFIDTLPSIRWSRQKVVFAGPVIIPR